MNDNDLLTNETAPKRRDELQIHNKKLGEVRNITEQLQSVQIHY